MRLLSIKAAVCSQTVRSTYPQRKHCGKTMFVIAGLFIRHQSASRKIVIDKLRGYRVAHRELILEAIHNISQYADNRAELSYQQTRVKERVVRRLKSIQLAQRFLSAHAAIDIFLILGVIDAGPIRHRTGRRKRGHVDFC